MVLYRTCPVAPRLAAYLAKNAARYGCGIMHEQVPIGGDASVGKDVVPARRPVWSIGIATQIHVKHGCLSDSRNDWIAMLQSCLDSSDIVTLHGSARDIGVEVVQTRRFEEVMHVLDRDALRCCSPLAIGPLI